MRHLSITLTLFLMFGCTQQSARLSTDEISKIENDIILRSEKHASDLENLDYKSVITFYADTEDFIWFGDGYYWGDFKTAEGVLNGMLVSGEERWAKIIKWDLQNHKVHVFSRDAASYLVEFDHLHVELDGDTVGSSGNFSYGMRKINGDWKAVTVHVSHIPERTNDEKWWSKFSPSKRK